MSNLLMLKKEVLSRCAFYETYGEISVLGFSQRNIIKALSPQVLK